MLRYLLLSVLIFSGAGQVYAESLLSVNGEISKDSPLLQTGEFHQIHKVTVEAGMMMTLTVTAEDFPPFVVVNTPEDRSFTRGESGDERQVQLDIVTITGGEYLIAVTTDKPGQKGQYLLEVTTLPLQNGLRGQQVLLDQQETLTDTDEDLGDGLLADTYTLTVRAGLMIRMMAKSTEFDVFLSASTPEGVILTADDVFGTNPEISYLAKQDGTLNIMVLSAEKEGRGAYRIQVRGVTVDDLPASEPEPKKPETEPQDPRIALVPAFEGTTLISPDDPAFKVTIPQPTPAALQNPGILADTLHKMNTIRVMVSGWSEMNEQNWIYPPNRYHETPRFFALDLDNAFQDAQWGTYTMPLEWNGNIFTCSHRKALDEHGGIIMLDVVGTVSPDGNRVEWVMIREYIQEAYWHEQDKAAYLSKREHSCISLVDLPLFTSFYNGEIDDTDYRFTTMQDLTKVSLNEVLRRGFSYGYNNQPEAGEHVLDLGYFLQDPAVRGHNFIDPDKIHSVTYLSTNWGNSTRTPSARVFFEYRDNARTSE